jgi:DNA-binding CsgD family transcriptional regulator
MSSDATAAPPLSLREQEILGHLAGGATYQAIADRLGLSPHTVDTYARRLRAKTGTANRTQLAVLAVRLGYAVQPSPKEPDKEPDRADRA